MSPESLRKLILARPFQPFFLRTPDGRAIEVPHPEFISMSRTGRTVYVSTEEFNGEGWEALDIRLIVGASAPNGGVLPSGDDGENGETP